MDVKRGRRSLWAAWIVVGLVASAVVAAGAPPAVALPPATVTLDLAAAVTVPGRCDGATVTVSPDKPGQDVTIQRLTGGSWKPLAAATLGAGSTVTVPLCFGWAALGTVPLRATWQSDGVDGDGTSPRVDLIVRRAPWMVKVGQLTSGHSMSVSIGDAGLSVYRHDDTVGRAPASNEKLLLSMTLLRRLGPDAQMLTVAAVPAVSGGVVQGNLWILGRGDPAITASRLATLAQHIRDAGITRISGHVMGSRGYFSHDWFAPGWKPDFPKDEVAMPTALTFNRNTANGVHITDPERRAAVSLARRLRAIGVSVGAPAGMGTPPGGLHSIATIISANLSTLIRPMDVYSLNFDAEVLGKRVGVERLGPPGTIAKGAAAIRLFAESNGVHVSAFDSSGLSYSNRVSAFGLVTLLRAAEATTWISALRQALPEAGQGTLQGRLDGVRVHAKTGTLTGISALSGWVWVEQEGRWAEFSILSSGDTTTLKHLEDSIVRVVAERGP